MVGKLTYNDFKMVFVTAAIKNVIRLATKGNKGYPTALANLSLLGTRDYNMALLIVSHILYCLISNDVEDEIKEWARTILRENSNLSNVLKYLREGNGDKIKYYMKKDNNFGESMDAVLKQCDELKEDSNDNQEKRKKIIENFIKQAGKIKRWKINKHDIEMLILKLQNKQLAEELTNKKEIEDKNNQLVEELTNKKEIEDKNKQLTEELTSKQAVNEQLIKKLKNKLAKGKKILVKKYDEITARSAENYRKNKASFEKYISKFKVLANRFGKFKTQDYKINDPDFANLILDFCECCADFYNDIDSKLISKDMEEENALYTLLYTLVSNFVKNKDLFQNTLTSFAKVNIEEIQKCIGNDGFTDALGAVLQCEFEGKDERLRIAGGVKNRAKEIRNDHVFSANIDKKEVQERIGGINKIIELKDKKDAEKSSKKQQKTENDIDLSKFFGDEKIEAKENKPGSNAEKNNEAVEKEKQDSNKKVEIENEKDKEKEKKPEEEQKQSGNQKPEVKAEKEVSDWEVIGANNKNQQESQQAESDVRGIIQNMAKNYIENRDLFIFPLNFPYVKAGCGVEENYNKELPKVLKELKEHLIKKGLDEKEVDVLFDNFINATAEKCDGHLYFSCDVNGVKKSVQADVGLRIKDLGITSIPESIKYKFINTDKFKSLFSEKDISEMLDNAPDALPKCSDNKKIYDLFFSNFFKNGENEFTLKQAFAYLNGVGTYQELGVFTRGKFQLAKGLISNFAPLDEIMIPLNWLIYAYDIRIQK